jgi:hypothetical protein
MNNRVNWQTIERLGRFSVVTVNNDEAHMNYRQNSQMDDLKSTQPLLRLLPSCLKTFKIDKQTSI